MSEELPPEILNEPVNRRRVEIRVHGIGDHGDWSQLGSPHLVKRGFPKDPDVAVPPTMLDHHLRLLNWSRTSRRRARLLWYVALPYTLVNAAGYMSAPDELLPTDKRPTRIAVVVTGMLLSLLTFSWAYAIVETVARSTWLEGTSSRAAAVWIASTVGGGLVAGMLVRRARRAEARVAAHVTALNVCVVVAAAAVTGLLRPAHWEVTAVKLPSFLTTWGPSSSFQQAPPGQSPPPFAERIANGELVPHADPLVWVSLGALAVASLFAVAYFARGVYEQTAGRPSTPHYATGVVLLTSVLMMMSVASALRLFTDNFTGYLSRHDLLLGGEPGARTPFSSRAMLPALNELYAARDDYVMDLLPLVGILAAMSLGLGMVLANLKQGGAGRPALGMGGSIDGRVRAAVWRRDLIVRLPSTFGLTVALSGLIWTGLTLLVTTWLFAGSGRIWELAVVAVQLVSVVAVIMLIAGPRFTAVRKAFGMLADVLGFWPVASHPFAGASYRNPVVEGIRDEASLAETIPVVLVGHSQGSVLCAWTVYEMHEAAAKAAAQATDDERDEPVLRLALITCGSPLVSLYHEFFPAYFSATFFSKILDNTAWTNFWRETDPIATTLPGIPDEEDVPIDDPRDGVIFGHSDYWIAQPQSERTEVYLHAL